MPLSPRACVIAALLVGPLAMPSHVGATTGPADDAQLAQDALAFLLSHRMADGNVMGASPAYVVDAIAQLGLDPKAWPSTDDSFYALLQPRSARSPLEADGAYKANARIAHAVGTSGYDPRDVHGRDLVAELRAGYVGSQAYTLDDAWAILALRAAGVPATDPDIVDAVDQLLAGRARDGGWGHTPAAETSGTDSTGMALAALAAAGRATDERGLALLRAREVAKGGYLDPTNDANPSWPNCQSTVWAIHGLSAMGANPPEHARGYLRSLRNTDGGFAQRLDDQGAPIASDTFCTVEALVLLAGAQFPLPGYARGDVRAPAAHALEPATLRVDGGYARAEWRFDDGTRLSGTRVAHAFATQGARSFTLLAEGAHHRWRTSGVLEILSARPYVELPTNVIDTLRGVDVVLDASRAHDPDGAHVDVEIAWGDGAVDRGAPGMFTHVYARPGDFEAVVRARDAAAYWSDPERVDVRVQNRPPSLEGLPSRIVADRLSGVQLPLEATDPEGDAVRFSWQYGNLSGEGTVSFIPPGLGNGTLEIVALDAFGANATARVAVEVVNLPPTLARLELPAEVEADVAFTARVVAEDADGPPPLVEWRTGDRLVQGEEANLSFATGTHEVTVLARDADGGLATLRASVIAVAPSASASEEPMDRAVAPRLTNASVSLDGAMLRVGFEISPSGAAVWLLRDGAPPVEVRDGARVPLEGAREARGVLEARAGNLTAAVAWGPLHVVVLPLAPVRVLPLPDAASAGANVVVRVAQHAEAMEFRFDFGDGNVTSWSHAREATHAWARPGAYEVRVQAREGERTAEATVVVRIDAPPAPAAVNETALEPSAAADTAAPASEETPVNRSASAPRPVPAPPLALLALAVLAALALARPRKRAPSAGR